MNAPDFDKLFEMLDKDEDGNLSKEEFTKGMEKGREFMMKMHARMARGPQGRMGPMGPRGPRGPEARRDMTGPRAQAGCCEKMGPPCGPEGRFDPERRHFHAQFGDRDDRGPRGPRGECDGPRGPRMEKGDRDDRGPRGDWDGPPRSSHEKR